MTGILRFIALAAGLAAAAAGPLQARDIEGWEIAPSNRGGCMMTAVFDDPSGDGVVLSLVWNEDLGQLGFLVASRDWDELRKRAGDPTALELTFDGNVPHRQWVHEGARFHDVGGSEAVMGVWGPRDHEDLAEAMSKSSQVSLKVGNTALGAFNISGAGKAYRELLRCGERS